MDSYAITERCSEPAVGVAQQQSGQFEREVTRGGRRWTRTSGLLHVKHSGLSAVLERGELSESASVIRSRW
jgi:hypothetical protein